MLQAAYGAGVMGQAAGRTAGGYGAVAGGGGGSGGGGYGGAAVVSPTGGCLSYLKNTVYAIPVDVTIYHSC